jgi:transcriptional regulator with XRE-family HTH domain
MVTKFNGLELKLARIRAKIRQMDLAGAAGMGASTLSLIENGWREARPEEIQRIKKALEAHGIELPTA